MIQQGQDEDSPVMNETLSVIDEHITDMKTPRSNGRAVAERRMTNDSGSEYSTHIDQRLSYIAGHETDEEERNPLTEREVPDLDAKAGRGEFGRYRSGAEALRDFQRAGDIGGSAARYGPVINIHEGIRSWPSRTKTAYLAQDKSLTRRGSRAWHFWKQNDEHVRR